MLYVSGVEESQVIRRVLDCLLVNDTFKSIHTTQHRF